MRIQYSLFDNLLEPVFVLSAEQKVVYCNETAASIAGLSVRKITRGMKFSELFVFNEEIDGIDNLVTVTDATPYKEVSFKAVHGEEGKVQITLQPVFDSMGDKNWIVFVRDVTLEERLQKKYHGEIEKKEVVIKDLEEAKLKLEDYSKNLELKVAERTKELSGLNQTLSALLDSLEQGFFIFGKDGAVLDVSSKACESTIECRPNGKFAWDVLKIAPNKMDEFTTWMQTIFMEMLPFEDLAFLGPETYPHSNGRNISLEYHPLRNAEGSTIGVVVVASDITSLVEAQKIAETEKEHAKLIIRMIKNKREIYRFIQESQGILAAIRAEVSKKKGPYDMDELFRYLHTLKGGSALYSVKKVSETCHEAETLLAGVKEKWSQEGFDALREKCYEIETAFQQFLAETKEILGHTGQVEERQVKIAVSKLNQIANKLGSLPGRGAMARDLLLELAMEPVERFIEPYDDVVKNLALRLEKNISPIRIHNGSIMVMPEVYNSLFSTLVHAFRNTVSHGIETPASRVDNNKAPEGSVDVSFDILTSFQGPHLLIKIKDDGAGINPEKIRAKLKERGIASKNETDQEVIQHIFDHQFSTSEEVSEISGRGVGMGAIKTAVDQLKGRVWVESEYGKGSCLIIEVPYLTEVKKESAKKIKAA